MVIICLTIIIAIIVITVMIIKSSKMGLICKKLSDVSGSVKNRKASLPVTDSESEMEV